MAPGHHLSARSQKTLTSENKLRPRPGRCRCNGCVAMENVPPAWMSDGREVAGRFATIKERHRIKGM